MVSGERVGGGGSFEGWTDTREANSDISTWSTFMGLNLKEYNT